MENYPKFTKSMRNTHTILVPGMLPIHFKLFQNVLTGLGYKVEILQNTSSDVITEGLKYVHNDTCYPATLVIGQFIDSLNNRTDLDKVALMITQTGGGCRASNYIHLLRKALSKAGYGYIPVVSLNMDNLEDNGFDLNLKLVKKMTSAMAYGDFLMYLFNKTRSYETTVGSSKALTDLWIEKISNMINNNTGLKLRQMKKILKNIAKDYDKLELTLTPKPKVGIVGEIYVKYAALGNNDLEEFLINEGAEILVPGLFGFLLYCFYNNVYDVEIYGGSKKRRLLFKFLIWYLQRYEKAMIKAINPTKFTPMQLFKHTKDLSEGIIGRGTKMGEGWLLTAEMMELVEIRYPNIVCAQPFGCLPNHICGKGVMKTIKQIHPLANIVAIDYDPSATKVNQENRIKLMLAIAIENMDKDVKL